MKTSKSPKRAVVCTPLIAALVVCTVGAAGYHLLKTVPVPGDYGWDYASADTESRRLYVGHDREVVVINLVEKVTTEIGARTLAVDHKTGRVYLPVGRFSPAPAGARGRGPMVPGSFHVLVFGE